MRAAFVGKGGSGKTTTATLFARYLAAEHLPVIAFDEAGIGTNCYHSKSGATELVLDYLQDDENEYAIVDMTAGYDLREQIDLSFVR